MKQIDEIALGFKELKLNIFAEKYEEVWQKCTDDNKAYQHFLKMLINMELESKHHARIKRLLKKSKIPRMKDINDFSVKRIPGLEQGKIEQLAKGDFIDRAENLLIFGNPGTGKTHLSIALTQEWCNAGRKALFITAAELMQGLLRAKKAVRLDEYIVKMNKNDILVIDDISYIPCDRQEADLLFTLLVKIQVLIRTKLINFHSKPDQGFCNQKSSSAYYLKYQQLHQAPPV